MVDPEERLRHIVTVCLNDRITYEQWLSAGWWHPDHESYATLLGLWTYQYVVPNIVSYDELSFEKTKKGKRKMYEGLKDLKKQLDAAKTEIQKKGRESFGAAFGELFEKHPTLKCVRWSQYTPWFNDGEACEFSVHGWEAVQHDDGVDDGELDPDCYDDDIPDDTADDVQAIFDLAGDDMFEMIFEDHVEVIANRDGTFQIDEYEHD